MGIFCSMVECLCLVIVRIDGEFCARTRTRKTRVCLPEPVIGSLNGRGSRPGKTRAWKRMEPNPLSFSARVVMNLIRSGVRSCSASLGLFWRKLGAREVFLWCVESCRGEVLALSGCSRLLQLITGSHESL